MPDVFISHITEEAAVADALKVYLKRCFGQTFSVFVSSDYDSIGTGEEWYHAIVDGILQARAVIVLLSKYSMDRPWINFEAGVAVGAKRRVIPVTIRSLPPAQVPFPLAGLHIRMLTDDLAVESLIGTIAQAVSREHVSEDIPGFVERLRAVEGILPVKGIALKPFLQRQSNSNPLLRFRLSNTGNRDIELIEIEVRVPKVITDPAWTIPSLLNGLTVLHQNIGDIHYVVLREAPFEGSIDPRYGRHSFFPKIVSPHWTPRLSDIIKIPVRVDVEDPAKWPIHFKVIARDVYSEEQSTGLNEIPYLD